MVRAPEVIATTLLACLAPFAQAIERSTPPPSGQLVASGAVEISASDLDGLIGNRLMRVRLEEYRIKRRLLEEHISGILIEREAAKRRITVEELSQAEVANKVTAPTADEVRGLYQSSRARFRDMPEELALAQVSNEVVRSRTERRRSEFAKELRDRAGVRVHLDAPRANIPVSTGPSLGPDSASVTIVEFSDFQCSFCSRSAPTMRQIRDKYGDQVQIVFRDFPLPSHGNAGKAAEAARCAAEQGKFWEMHDTLFRNQGQLTVTDFKRYATVIGVEAGAFDSCLDSGRHEATWRKDVELGQSLGIPGTPAFFVNGMLMVGPATLEAFSEAIDEELAALGNLEKRTTSLPARD